MPAARKDTKALRTNKRRDPLDDPATGDDFEDCALPVPATLLTDEQVKLRNIIPALTPAHGPESTSSAILAALSLGNHRPNSHTRRKSDGHVNRPPNAFIVFRRAQVQNMPANITQHQQRISNLTASFWRVLTQSEQNTWYSLADDIKRLHTILFPDYNFNPRNPDGSKKPMLPRAGLTAERLEFAWKEAQELVRKHTVMGVHPPAPPACMMGKVARPKVPRKGQGTRAKERREQEAAQRAATATLTAMEAAAGFDATLQGGGVEGIMYPYPPTVIEEESVASPSDSAIIAWRPDFSLEGSVSSKSSPTNSWTELVGTNGEHQIDPLDASSSSKTNATATTAAYDALPTSATSANYDYEYDYGVTSFDGTGQGPAIVDDFEFGGMVTQGRFIGAPFHHHHHHPHHQHHQTTTSTTTGANQGPYGVSSMTKPIALPVSGMPPPPQQQQQKQYAHTHAHTYLPMPVLEGGHVATAMYYSAPLPVDASSSANHEYAAAAAAMPAYTTTTAGQVEAQYIFHDMDPMTSASSSSYFDIPTAYAATAEYAW